jgi:hypothetical protein
MTAIRYGTIIFRSPESEAQESFSDWKICDICID